MSRIDCEISEKAALRCSESFFDNSKARLHCKSKTRPSGSNSWICGRSASLRIITEKILIRAQSSFFRTPVENECGLRAERYIPKEGYVAILVLSRVHESLNVAGIQPVK